LSTLQGRVKALTAPVKIDIKTKKTISAASIDFGQFYSLFVDKFRGPEDLIQKRLSQHIPHAKIANENTSGSAPFLAMDIGCGRGEWLKLLRNEELNALGVDTNREILDHCREQGLNVQEGDAFGALSERKNSSVSLLTAFHLIEHMDFPDQLRFIYEAHRVLRPGGILIAETPNVGNVDVGASGFYHDPTHIRPVPWPLAKFMAEYTGFAEAEIRFLNPDSPDESSDKGETNVEWRERFHGPRDYALIARK
jgi:O-antigen chain-terminating methyltransferase